MNKKALALIAIITAAAIGTGAAYTNQYFIEQADVHIRDSNVTIDNSNVTLGENVTITNPPQPQPTTMPPESTAEPKSTPTPTPTLKPLLYNYAVFEWYLKTEYVNNMTWLTGALGTKYNSGKTWTENYIVFLAKFEAFPSEASGSLAAFWLLTQGAFVNAEFNQETGWTKVTYKYYESEQGRPYLYSIETAYPSLRHFADERGWTKTFI